MKTFYGIFLAMALFELTYAVTKEYHERATAAKDKCAKEFGIDEETIKEFVKNKKLPETKDGKCMLNCFMEEMKAIKDGKINVEELKANNKHKWDKAEFVAAADEVVDKCAAEVSPDGMDKCEFAVAFMKCAITNGMEKNIPPPDMNPKRR